MAASDARDLFGREEQAVAKLRVDEKSKNLANFN
jgi:hypothetical protein